MRIKILIVVTGSSGILKMNIAVLTKFNLEARFLAYLLFLITLRYIFAQIIPNLLLDKDSITLHVEINVHII